LNSYFFSLKNIRINLAVMIVLLNKAIWLK